MRTLLRALVAITLVAAAATGYAQTGQSLTRIDRQGPVTVELTLVAPPAAGAPLRVKVVLDTHSVALDAVALDQAVLLRAPDGTEVAPTAVEQAKGSGHHREAVLVFPPSAATGPLRIVVKSVGGVPERTFTWELASGAAPAGPATGTGPAAGGTGPGGGSPMAGMGMPAMGMMREMQGAMTRMAGMLKGGPPSAEQARGMGDVMERMAGMMGSMEAMMGGMHGMMAGGGGGTQGGMGAGMMGQMAEMMRHMAEIQKRLGELGAGPAKP